MSTPTTDRILHALFCLSRDTQFIDASELGQIAGTTPTSAAEALATLERAGLVDATRVRLTLLGLARAAQLSAAGGGGVQVQRATLDLSRARPQTALKPVAAKASVSRLRPLTAASTRNSGPDAVGSERACSGID